MNTTHQSGCDLPLTLTFPLILSTKVIESLSIWRWWKTFIFYFFTNVIPGRLGESLMLFVFLVKEARDQSKNKKFCFGWVKKQFMCLVMFITLSTYKKQRIELTKKNRSIFIHMILINVTRKVKQQCLIVDITWQIESKISAFIKAVFKGSWKKQH